MLVACTTIGSAPRTILIWVRVRELGFKRITVGYVWRSRPPKSMDEDPFTCALRVVGSTLENDINLRF